MHAKKSWTFPFGVGSRCHRVIIAVRFKASRPDRPTPEEINIIRQD
jgi:hypothetical protein